MLFAKEQYPNKRLDELITVNGYAIDIPLGMQELPVFWHNNYPLVEKIRNERIKHGVVILDDLIDNATSTVVVEPEDDEEVPIVPPKGKRKPKQLESKSDGNIRRTLDRALRRLNIETTTPIYNGMGDADGTYADPVLEEWPEGEIERGEDIERQRAELRAARMLEGNDVTIPDAGGRGVPNEEKGTPGVFPAQLRKYWLGKGLSRWATTPTPYRSLVAALRSEGVSGRMVNGLAARLYHWHFGTWPGKNHGKKNFKFTDYDGVQAVKLEEKKLHGDETKDGDA